MGYICSPCEFLYLLSCVPPLCLGDCFLCSWREERRLIVNPLWLRRWNIPVLLWGWHLLDWFCHAFPVACIHLPATKTSVDIVLVEDCFSFCSQHFKTLKWYKHTVQHWVNFFLLPLQGLIYSIFIRGFFKNHFYFLLCELGSSKFLLIPIHWNCHC